jgi:hypothetical protein
MSFVLACVFPFALAAVDYNFCIPDAEYFICSLSRVIDKNSTLNSLDCSRNSSLIVFSSLVEIKT